MADVNKRLKYFNGQFLQEKDFQDEQDYHLDRQRRHNRLLHTPGVAEGLEVQADIGATEATVKPGTAIDSEGRVILLIDERKISLTGFKSEIVLLLISYHEESSDEATSGGSGKTRWDESPKIDAVRAKNAPTDATFVRLGVLAVDDQGRVAPSDQTQDIDSGRTGAGARVGTSLSIRELVFPRDGQSQGMWPRLALDQSNSLTVQQTEGIAVFHLQELKVDNTASVGTLRVVGTGNSQINGNFGLGVAPTRALHVGTNRSVRFELGAGQSISIGAPGTLQIDAAGVPGGRLIVTDAGQVGIGTATPENNEGWEGVLDLVGKSTAKISVRTGAIDARVMSHNSGWWGAPPGLVIGTKTKHAISLGTNTVSRITVDGDGRVGVGTANPQYTLDVKASSIKLGLEGNGGGQLVLVNNPNDNKVWLEAYSTDGSKSADEMLLTGRNGGPVAQISLLAQRTVVSGNLFCGGAIAAGGGKGGYVMDQFVNNLDDTVEQGDVVIIAGKQPSHQYGLDSNIPVPEVDLATQAYDARVCGVVCDVYGVIEPETIKQVSKGAKQKTTPKAKATQPREFSQEELASMDKSVVAPGQIGWMVTLGAFAYCKVDADIAPIKMGDLLTTSPTKGHAQKVLDPAQATGAIVGKALGALSKGKGKLPILVTLH